MLGKASDLPVAFRGDSMRSGCCFSDLDKSHYGSWELAGLSASSQDQRSQRPRAPGSCGPARRASLLCPLPALITRAAIC